MSDTAFETWGVEQSPITIEYSLVVLEEIRHHVSQGLLKFSRGGIEVGGILYGSRDGRKIRIESIRIIECDHASGPSFTLSDSDRARLEEQIAADSSDPQLHGLVRVGWFVSHTRTDLALTDSDLELFATYFREPWQVTLVIRPGRGSQMRAAFFVWEQDGTVQSSQSYKEFNFPDRLAGVIDSSSRTERAETRAGHRTLPPLPPPPVRVERPRPQVQMPVFESSQYMPAPPPERKKWPWILGSLAILIVLTFLGLRYLWQPLPPETLDLAVLERNGMLEVQWSNQSGTIARAEGGSLDIVDGTATQRVPLTRSQLSEGRYVYARQGGDVEVRMVVRTSNGEVRESTRFLGRPPEPAAPESVATAPDAAPAVDEEKLALQQQLNQLKAENATLQERVQQLERTRAILESRIFVIEGAK